MSTPNTIQSRAVQLALAEKGYKEGRRNWNKFARDTYPDVQNQAWCGSFVGDVYRRAGWDSRGLVWMPYVPYIESWAKKIGAWKTTRAQHGDIVVYGFGRSSGQHTGIAYPDESTGGDSYRAIEGNTSSGNSGSQTNGDGVYVRYRRRRDIRGWVDMAKVLRHYGVQGGKAAPAKPKTEAKVKASGKIDEDGRFGRDTVRALQRWLNREHKAKLDVDGKAGYSTWRALQRALGAPYADGKISRQSHSAKSLGNGITQGWEHTGPNSKGSQTVKLLQRLIGVNDDGVWVEKTTRALQKFLNKRGAGA